MKTNDLKSGTVVRLRNGWNATLLDNKKGNTRHAEVEGFVKEKGDIYSHDIIMFKNSDGEWDFVEHTDKQKKCREMNRQLFG